MYVVVFKRHDATPCDCVINFQIQNARAKGWEWERERSLWMHVKQPESWLMVSCTHAKYVLYYALKVGGSETVIMACFSSLPLRSNRNHSSFTFLFPFYLVIPLSQRTPVNNCMEILVQHLLLNIYISLLLGLEVLLKHWLLAQCSSKKVVSSIEQ